MDGEYSCGLDDRVLVTECVSDRQSGAPESASDPPPDVFEIVGEDDVGEVSPLDTQVVTRPAIDTYVREARFIHSIASSSDPPLSTLDDVREVTLGALERRRKHLGLHELDKVDEDNALIEKLATRAYSHLFRRRCSQTLEGLDEQLADSREERRVVLNDMQKRLQIFEATSRAELERFDAEWDARIAEHRLRGPDEVAKFRRRSPRLLELWRRRSTLEAQHRIGEARAMNGEIDKLEAAESAAAVEAARAAWSSERRRLERMRERARACLLDRQERDRRDLVSFTDRLVDANAHRETRLEREVADVRAFSRRTERCVQRRHLSFLRGGESSVPKLGAVDTEKLTRRMPESARAVLLGRG